MNQLGEVQHALAPEVKFSKIDFRQKNVTFLGAFHSSNQLAREAKRPGIKWGTREAAYFEKHKIITFQEAAVFP
jgi:hypothetical protein